MLNNLFSLKTDLTKIHLIKEEVELFNSIDKNIIDNFKKILCKFFMLTKKNSLPMYDPP